MGTRKWNVIVSCMTTSYNYTEYAPDKDTAIEIVRGRVMPDMRNWNFSATLDGDNGCDNS